MGQRSLRIMQVVACLLFVCFYGHVTMNLGHKPLEGYFLVHCILLGTLYKVYASFLHSLRLQHFPAPLRSETDRLCFNLAKLSHNPTTAEKMQSSQANESTCSDAVSQSNTSDCVELKQSLLQQASYATGSLSDK